MFWRDLAERTAATYVQAFVGLLIVSWPADVDWSVLQIAAWAAVPAGLAVVKGAAASFIGAPDSASLLPGVGEPTNGGVHPKDPPQDVVPLPDHEDS